MLAVAVKAVSFAFIIAAMLGIAAAQTPAEQETRSRNAVVEDWLNRYHDANSLYLIFPNGQIFTGRAKWTGIFIGRLNLWHCFGYMPLRYRGDEDIYLHARIVQFTDEDAKDVAARYGTQCALETYPGDPYTHVMPRHAAR